MFALERWDARDAAWITVATFATSAEARARGWELRLPHTRVREVSAVEMR